MALPPSGPLSIDDIVGEFGGTAPNGLNDYYRNGGLVPSTKLSVGGWTGTYSVSSDAPWQGWYEGVDNWPNSVGSVWINNAQVTFIPSPSNRPSYVSGGYQYERQDYVGTTVTGGEYYYFFRRRTYANVAVNQSVPTTGTISIADFYGATA